MSEYAPLCIYLVISTLLSLVILGLSFVFSTQKADPEKVSAYECGFDPFDDARARFDAARRWRCRVGLPGVVGAARGGGVPPGAGAVAD